MTKSLVRRTL